MNEVKKTELLERVYRKLPRLACKGLCSESCGPIGASALEIRRLERAAGKQLGFDAHLACSMLTAEKRCAAYGARPLICRIFGATRKLECRHGCKPERWVSDGEAAELFERVDRIGGEPRLAADLRDSTAGEC